MLAALLTLALLALWRSAADLDGHIRAGAQLVVEAVAAGAGSADPAPGGTAQQIAALLPGIGDPTPFRVPPDAPPSAGASRRSRLRAPGATVLAIVRGGQSVVVPTADEVLQAGDVLALAGAEEAVAAAPLGRRRVEAVSASAGHASADEHTARQIATLLPGIGEPVPFRLPPDSPALGRSLAELNLRGATGATVLAIVRGETGVLVPTAHEVLQPGDVLALRRRGRGGLAAARALLGGRHERG